MGKYMRKSKTTGEMVLMDVSHHPSPPTLGVRTRAKTLALQRLGKLTAASPSTAAGGGSYLELRSRRLEKPIFVREQKQRRQKQLPKESPNPSSNFRASSRLKVGSVNSGTVVGSECLKCLKEEKGNQLERQKVVVVVDVAQEIQEKNAGIEASFGENVLEFEGRERGRRETTPCSLLRDPDTIRPANSSEAIGTAQNSKQKHIPTAHEMNEFFTGVEDKQQKQFTEKYNFDPVNEKPLPGRYEWVKVDP